MDTDSDEKIKEEQKIEESKKHFTDYLKNLIQLRGNIDSKSIKEAIYEDMVFRGPTVWILVCSIVIASIGLNVSSAAVVIGAMLISPLMSPIVAIGLAVGTYNWPKLMSALKNFAIMVLVSLITSYLYFLISPLKVPSPEIISRTEPTLLDVFIAFVGGSAGIIAISQKKISNVIPGVAIATALMPPLCTAGFGLATLNFGYFWGGFYLFILNSIMIALATYIVVTYLKFPNYKYLDEKKAKILKRYMTLFIIAILIPSVFVFYGLVKSSSFNRAVDQFIIQVNNVNGNRLLKHIPNYSSDSSSIELLYLELDNNDLSNIKEKFATYNFENTSLIIHQGSRSADEMLSEVLSKKSKEERLNALEATSRNLSNKLKVTEDSLAWSKKELTKYEHFNVPFDDLKTEILTLFPNIERISVANILHDTKSKLNNSPCIFVTWKRRTKEAEKQKLKEFVQVRLKVKNVLISELK